MNSFSKSRIRMGKPITEEEAAYWDRELVSILKTAAGAAGLVAAGGLAGALFGWLEWNVRFFAPVSTLALAVSGAGLAWLLRKLFHRERSLPVILLGLMLAAALVLGFEAARYRAFRVQTGREITERMTADLKVVYPVQLPGLIDEFLERRTGKLGVEGYFFLFNQLQGISFSLLAVFRALLTLSAVVVVLQKRRRRRRKVHPMGWGEKL